mgnify:CR=1 FL=1
MRARYARRDLTDERIAKLRHTVHVLRHIGAALIQRRRHRGRGGHVARPGAHITLLRAAVHERLHRRAAAAVERADALRSVELMRREREHIHVIAPHVHRDMPDRLHRVRVEHNAPLAAERANVGNGLNGAELIVGVHYADKAGVRPQRR